MDPFILGHIGNALRRQFDDIANEPLPEHLIELINLMNEQERAQSGVSSSNQPLSAFIEKARHRLIESARCLFEAVGVQPAPRLFV